MKYTNDLDGYIENLKELLEQAKLAGDVELRMMLHFSIAMAEEFQLKGKTAS